MARSPLWARKTTVSRLLDMPVRPQQVAAAALALSAAPSVIHTGASREEILRTLFTIPRRVSQRSAAAQAMYRRVADAVLTHIRAAFVTKAAGGTDEAGDRWAPLAASTIRRKARRMMNRTERKREANPDQGYTKRQQEQWQQAYRRGLIITQGEKSIARRYAFDVMRRAGAETIYDKYAPRVQILIETGRLLNSLTPQATGTGAGDRVFRIEPGAVVIGTSRKGAAKHHHGNPGRRLPQRRLWPAPMKWPAGWWRSITDEVRRGVVEVITELATQT